MLGLVADRSRIENITSTGDVSPATRPHKSKKITTAMSKTLFQKIIDREIPAKIAYEDDRAIVIHDISPQAPVHVLVIPKKPIPTLNDLTPADADLVGHLFLTASKVMAELGYRDYRTVFNCGAGAQQTVFHLHLHVLAGRPMTWPPG
jgi:histidine triad (HIT) family protein